MNYAPMRGELQAKHPPLLGEGDQQARREVTDNAVLGGRLRLLQPKRGHRVGHDALLLAAACPANPGDTVVDLGAGVGAAGLALAVRVAANVTLVEIDADLAALAADNARRNGLNERVRVLTLDVTAPARAFSEAGLGPQSCECAMMNPPFNDPRRHQLSPDLGRRIAHVAPRETLAVWIKAATRLLRPQGTLSLIWRADGLADVLAALQPGFGSILVLPVYARRDEIAIRVLIRASKSMRSPLAILPGLVLAEDDGRPTSEADAVLRGGEPLTLAKA
jgi:tRNA1(Val) A37 N6-methylase TrmN6